MIILRFKIQSKPDKSDELMSALAEILTTDSGATADNASRALAHAVSPIISRPEALRRTSARRRAEQFTWPRAAAGMLGALGAV